jgi:hypothetical protein
MTRWHHGHSLGAGLLGGLLVAGHDPWLLIAAGFLAGAGATLAAIGGWRLAQTLLGAFEAWRDQARARREPVATGIQARYDLRPSRRRTT